MKKLLYVPYKGALILCALILLSSLSACSTTAPSKYYLLSPTEDTTPASSKTNIEDISIIGVGPIKFPKYLSRSQITRFSNDNEILVEEFNRWAEPLEQNFSRVLRVNLSRLIPSSYAIDYPWKRSLNVRYQVMLDVHQFETTSDGRVNLNAHWVLFDLSKNNKIKSIRKFNYTTKVKGIEHSKAVALQSAALEKLSKEIATELKNLLDTK